MADCARCGGSNRVQYQPCPRCGLHDPTEMAAMLASLQAGSAPAAQQAAVTTEQTQTADQPGTTG